MPRPKPYIEHDKYFKQAKKIGLRARSGFKLLQIEDRMKIIREGDAVLDLGCFPGSWLQVAKKLTGDRGTVVGVDLEVIKPLEGVKTFVGDIFEEKTIEEIRKAYPKKFNTLLSDMAPKTSGMKDMDTYRSYELNVKVLETAKALLRKNGNLVTKIFSGEELEVFYKELSEHFKMVRRFKPKATRARSFEIYFVGIGFNG
jgi:23S rRNA (uridine2552-2'-O)-methyltransferase